MDPVKQLLKDIKRYSSVEVRLTQPPEALKIIRAKHLNLFISGEDEYQRPLCYVKDERVILTQNPITKDTQSGTELLRQGVRVWLEDHPLASIQRVLQYGIDTPNNPDKYVTLIDDQLELVPKGFKKEPKFGYSVDIDNVRYFADRGDLKKHLLGISVWKRHYCFMNGISPQRLDFYPVPKYTIE